MASTRGEQSDKAGGCELECNQVEGGALECIALGEGRQAAHAPLLTAVSTTAMALAVFTGTVERSTMTLGVLEAFAMTRAIRSQCCRSGAKPLFSPESLRGVETDTKTISASWMAASMSSVKKRFVPRTCSPGESGGQV